MRKLGAVCIALQLSMTAPHASAASGALSAPLLPDTLTVEACAELARHRAPAIVAADLEGQAAAFESSAVAHNKRPDLAFVGRAFVAPKGFYDPVVTNLGEYEARLVLDYGLLDGGARGRARARGTLDLAAARLAASREARDVGLEAADFAIDHLRLAEVEGVQRRNIDWIDRLASLLRGAVRAAQERGEAIDPIDVPALHALHLGQAEVVDREVRGLESHIASLARGREARGGQVEGAPRASAASRAAVQETIVEHEPRLVLAQVRDDGIVESLGRHERAPDEGQVGSLVVGDGRGLERRGLSFQIRGDDGRRAVAGELSARLAGQGIGQKRRRKRPGCRGSVRRGHAELEGDAHGAEFPHPINATGNSGPRSLERE